MSFNPSTAKLFNLNFHPLEVVSRWRDPQLQVSENYSDLTKWRSTLFKSCWLMSLMVLTCLKGGTECGNNWVKNPIYAAPAVKGLMSGKIYTVVRSQKEVTTYLKRKQLLPSGFAQLYPSKHDTSTQCLTNAGTPFTTLAKHWSSSGWMCRVCWDSELPSKHETFIQCWVNVGPSSATLTLHWPNIGWTSRVCWIFDSCGELWVILVRCGELWLVLVSCGEPW